jgi:hypothetical protein
LLDFSDFRRAAAERLSIIVRHSTSEWNEDVDRAISAGRSAVSA